jgi:hypothetical protein
VSVSVSDLALVLVLLLVVSQRHWLWLLLGLGLAHRVAHGPPAPLLLLPLPLLPLPLLLLLQCEGARLRAEREFEALARARARARAQAHSTRLFCLLQWPPPPALPALSVLPFGFSPPSSPLHAAAGLPRRARRAWLKRSPFGQVCQPLRALVNMLPCLALPGAAQDPAAGVENLVQDVEREDLTRGVFASQAFQG